MSRSSWTIAFGRWCFRYRNAAFPIIFVSAALILRPRLMGGHPGLDRALVDAGALIALLGEAVRLLTIGLDYVERGGKNKQVAASQLVQGGIYAHTRNPMYLGNLLIAGGMSMVMGAPGSYLILIPLFIFVYHAIMSTEEAFLHQKFGADYVAYCNRVPRMWPLMRGLGRTIGGMEYHWRRAIRKDLSTIVGLLLGLIALPVWRSYFLEGLNAAKARLPIAAAEMASVLVLYVVLHALKKHRIFFYLPTNVPRHLPGGLR